MKNKVKVDEIVIDGTTYVPKDSVTKKQSTNGMEYVMVRTYSAGVHCGYLKKRDGKEVHLVEAIRIHYWDGACSLSQLAIEGTKKPDNCRFAMPVDITLTEAIEIIPMTEEAFLSITNTKTWKK